LLLLVSGMCTKASQSKGCRLNTSGFLTSIKPPTESCACH
jgi:hypothetical protein